MNKLLFIYYLFSEILPIVLHIIFQRQFFQLEFDYNSIHSYFYFIPSYLINANFFLMFLMIISCTFKFHFLVCLCILLMISYYLSLLFINNHYFLLVFNFLVQPSYIISHYSCLNFRHCHSLFLIPH